MTETRPLSTYSRRGNIYYTSARHRERSQRPQPPFRPRQRRPHSIHVTRLPANYCLDEPSSPIEPLPLQSRRTSLKLATKDSAKKVLSLVLAVNKRIYSTRTGTITLRSATPNHLPSHIPRVIVTSDDAEDLPTTSTRSLDRRFSQQTAMLTLAPVLTERRSFNSSRSDLSSPVLAPRAEDRPVASGNGVACSIILNEPHVFLTGFDHDGRGHNSQNSCAILRGKLQLDVTKSVKLKAVTLKFTGRARTEWPEGLPPEKTKYSDSKDIRTTVMPFFNAMHPGAESGYGSQCVYTPSNKLAERSSTNLSTLGLKVDKPETNGQSNFLMLPVPIIGGKRASAVISAREKRLSLGSVQSPSFQRDESPSPTSTPQQKGYKVFHPGVYEYGFELTIDHTNPETIDVPLGSVKWELEASVERAGTFKANLLGTREVKIIRAPDQNSLEQVEPIAISRNWEDQLHYEIVISGKSFPLGSKIPIGFKLTPLAKVQCHRIKIYATENIEYFTHDNRITRKDSTRKILLFEKHAGKPIAPQFQRTELRTVAGGELNDRQRAEARRTAQTRRDREAQRSGVAAAPLPPHTENLLGDLDLGLESLITSTEFEMNVQLPTCADMKKDKRIRIHPDTTYRQIQIHHWIKVVLRLSKLDTEDPSGTKRRHFEISIDSPFHILSCMADQSNTSLPEYSEFGHRFVEDDRPCGCPDATSHPTTPQATLPPVLAPVPDVNLARPQEAHVHEQRPNVQRPNNVLRNPSYGPPPFDEEEPPPPLQTPPPEYDLIAGTPSRDTLGDYFRRLADAYSDSDHTDDEDDARLSRGGRVNIPNPRTPGNRMARSMDIDRNFMFRPGALEARANRAAGRT